jgi:hypothetical protein
MKRYELSGDVKYRVIKLDSINKTPKYSKKDLDLIEKIKMKNRKIIKVESNDPDSIHNETKEKEHIRQYNIFAKHLNSQFKFKTKPYKDIRKTKILSESEKIYPEIYLTNKSRNVYVDGFAKILHKEQNKTKFNITSSKINNSYYYAFTKTQQSQDKKRVININNCLILPTITKINILRK